MPFEIAVRSTDLDADQIVTNAVYLASIERAQLAFLRKRAASA